MPYQLLTLNKQPYISPAKWVYEQQRVAILDMQSNGKAHASPEDKGKEYSLVEERESSEALL